MKILFLNLHIIIIDLIDVGLNCHLVLKCDFVLLKRFFITAVYQLIYLIVNIFVSFEVYFFIRKSKEGKIHCKIISFLGLR